MSETLAGEKARQSNSNHDHDPELRPVHNFWRAVVQPNSVSVDQTGKKLRFNNGYTGWGWMGKVKELYVRDCYISALDSLNNAKVAMIEGSSGSGKSVFIFFFIYMVVNRCNAAMERIPTFLVEDSDGFGWFLRLDTYGNAIRGQGHTNDAIARLPSTDSKGRCCPSFRKQYIHVTSTRNINLKEVRNLLADNRFHASIYFVLFSLDEFMDIIVQGSDEANKEAMMFYYDVFGGSLYNIYGAHIEGLCNSPYPAEIYRVVDAQMTSFFGGYALAGVSKSVGTIIHYVPSAQKSAGWLHIPVSRFMRHLIGHICNPKTNDILSVLSKVLSCCGHDYVHEHAAHEFRMRHLGQKSSITLWSLQNQPPATLRLPIKRVVRLRTVGDFSLLKDGDYGLPTTSNFPCVDAVMTPHYLFRDVEQPDEHVSVTSMPDIVQALGMEAASAVVVHSVAAEMFDRFEVNSNDVTLAFSQWKTRTEVHKDDRKVPAAALYTTGNVRRSKRKRSVSDKPEDTNTTKGKK